MELLRGVFRFPPRDRERVACFMSYCAVYMSTLEKLLADHEPDEVATQMALYRDMIKRKAELGVYAHSFQRFSVGSGEFTIDNIPPPRLADLFFSDIEYADGRPKIYGATSSRGKLLSSYLKEFGAPYDAPTRIMNAEIRGDAEMASALRKYSG